MQIQVSLTIDLNANVNLTQMEEQVQRAGHLWMRQAFQQAVRQWEEAHRCCPVCGSTQVRTEGTVQRSILALFGPVSLARRRYRCQHCHQRFCPSKALLGSLSLARISQPLKAAAMMAGASWPYRHAAACLHRLSGAQISAEEIRLLTNAEGQACAHRQAEQVDLPISSTPTPASEQEIGPLPPPPASVSEQETDQWRCVIGLDGGWVSNREKRGGMEGKVAVIASGEVWSKEPERPNAAMTWYELSRYVCNHRRPPRRRSRWSTRRYVATFVDARLLGQQAEQAVHTLGLQQHPQVVVADGAHWIKKETDRHFPQALRILDWPHLWRTMRKAANTVGLLTRCSDHEHAHQVKQLGAWLWKGEVEPAKALLLQWQHELAGQPAPRLAALKQAITYLEQQRDWIGSYEQWKRQGYPVGSGIIERAVTIVINRRMKRRGMRWLRKNATAVVALRVDLLNQDWYVPASSRLYP
jgi:hypothetical protein